jgi:hypothetical protein
MGDSDADKPPSGPGAGLDPEIAQLMGLEPDAETDKQADRKEGPQFGELFQETPAARAAEPAEPPPIDVGRKSFEPVKDLSGRPQPYFQDKDYYRKVLAGEGDIAKRVHELLTAFVNATDPQDKSLHRGRLTPAFWELLASATRSISSSMPVHKRLLFRFGLLSPAVISEAQRTLLSSVFVENRTGEPIHYLDEWLAKVARGEINASAVDEVKQARRTDDQKVLERMEKLEGQRAAELNLLRSKVSEIDNLEQELARSAQLLARHDLREDLGGIKACLNAAQRAMLPRIVEILRSISSQDREMSSTYRSVDTISQELEALKQKADGIDTSSQVDTRTLVNELGSVRQMHKLCCGRQGNHFPVLYQSYFRPSLKEIGIRENVINLIAKVEALDPSLFLRTFKGRETRIVPHVILLPCYGENGICWEPFERKNRSSSRGRIALPLFPKDISYAVLAALGDLRWQVAKEKAQHYWMEEGITGKYYQWFESTKQKGDVKEAFIRDYVLWITKESEGMQKLEKEVRGVFWREMPFPQSTKDNLKNRGFVYAELYKKDQNRAMSDGY